MMASLEKKVLPLRDVAAQRCRAVWTENRSWQSDHQNWPEHPSVGTSLAKSVKCNRELDLSLSNRRDTVVGEVIDRGPNKGLNRIIPS